MSLLSLAREGGWRAGRSLNLRPACQPDESRRASSPDGGGAPPASAKRSNSAAEVGLFRIFGNPIGAIEVRCRGGPSSPQDTARRCSKWVCFCTSECPFSRSREKVAGVLVAL